MLWVQRRHNCSPAASFANCVMTLYLFRVHLQTFLSTGKCQILSCDTLVANERYLGFNELRFRFEWRFFVFPYSLVFRTALPLHLVRTTEGLLYSVIILVYIQGADKSLARPDWKNKWKVAIFRPTRWSLLPRRPGWAGNLLKCFWVACKVRVWSL